MTASIKKSVMLLATQTSPDSMLSCCRCPEKATLSNNPAPPPNLPNSAEPTALFQKKMLVKKIFTASET
ncbi:hypothetical protein Mapa_000870 [Marchantia paleacea]|nr:hypothetical protein Mapa_000870 [Marchantia paleacea]